MRRKTRTKDVCGKCVALGQYGNLSGAARVLRDAIIDLPSSQKPNGGSGKADFAKAAYDLLSLCIEYGEPPPELLRDAIGLLLSLNPRAISDRKAQAEFAAKFPTLKAVPTTALAKIGTTSVHQDTAKSRKRSQDFFEQTESVKDAQTPSGRYRARAARARAKKPTRLVNGLREVIQKTAGEAAPKRAAEPDDLGVNGFVIPPLHELIVKGRTQRTTARTENATFEPIAEPAAVPSDENGPDTTGTT